MTKTTIALGILFACSGCLQSTGVVAKTNTSTSLSQNCLLPNSASVANISRKLAGTATAMSPEFCGSISSYTCNRKLFSPTVTNGKSIAEECTHLAELGGDVCLKVNVQTYSTAEAAKRSDISATSLQPGGDLNRSDYLCYQSSLVDGDNFLAVGEGDHLNEALAAALVQCNGVSPRLTVGK